MATVFTTRDKGPEIVKKLNGFAGEFEEGMGDLTQAVEDAEAAAVESGEYRDEANLAATNAANDVRSQLEGYVQDGQDLRNETEEFRDETALIKADFETAFGGLSYLAPVEYDAGINIDSAVKTVEYDGEVYAPLPSEVPFTTSGTFETDKFRLIQGVTTQQMASTAAGGFAANIGRNVIAVDSIADLLALPAGVRRADLRYLVKSYHAGSDVGGGEFYWDAASTATANDGTVLQVPGVESGRFIRRIVGAAVSLEDFGAVGGDVERDTEAFLRASAAINQYGYSLKQNTAREFSVDFSGAMSNQPFFDISKPNCIADFCGSTVVDASPIGTVANSAVFFRLEGDMTEIRGLNFVGSGQGIGIRTVGKKVKIQFCTVQNVREYGITALGQGSLVADCLVDGVAIKDGIRLNGDKSRAVRCKAINCNRWTFCAAHSGDDYDVTVYFDDCEGDGSVDFEDFGKVFARNLNLGTSGTVTFNGLNQLVLIGGSASSVYSGRPLTNGEAKSLCYIRNFKIANNLSYAATLFSFKHVILNAFEVIAEKDDGDTILEMRNLVPGNTMHVDVNNCYLVSTGGCTSGIIAGSGSGSLILDVSNTTISGYTDRLITPENFAGVLTSVNSDDGLLNSSARRRQDGDQTTIDLPDGTRIVQVVASIDVSVDSHIIPINPGFSDEYLFTSCFLTPDVGTMASSGTGAVNKRDALKEHLVTASTDNTSHGYGGNRFQLRLFNPHSTSLMANVMLTAIGKRAT